MTITFPYPPSKLNPNRPKHWAAKAKLFKAYKEACMWSIRKSDAKVIEGQAAYKITFCPPDKRRRDMDNAIASIKALIDALSWASGVDDSKFVITYAWGDPMEHGAVIVDAA